MGTLLQEVGHDAVIYAFIDKVMLEKSDFFLVSGAIGPKIDLYQKDGKTGRLTSAYSSAEGYIPLFTYRLKLGPDEEKRLDEESKYRESEWYIRLAKNIGRDPKQFLSGICRRIEDEIGGGLPDIIGFSERGEILVLAEIKFEGLSRKTLPQIESGAKIAKKIGARYYLVVPKNPIYASELTDVWLKRNAPQNALVYKFVSPKGTIVPKQEELFFVEVK